MQTDQVTNLINKIIELSRNTYQSSDVISSLNNPEIWQGSVAEYFWTQLTSITRKLHLASEDMTKLGLSLSKEQDQWVEVDQQGVFRIRGTSAPVQPGQDQSFGFQVKRAFEGLSDAVENYKFNKDYKRFKAWWQTQSIDEKKAYLQNLQNEYADQMGWPRMLIVADDLVDPANGDARGLNIDEILILDIDNFNTDDPWRLMEDLFHETRHQYQREVVSNFQTNGTIPSDMTQSEIENWVYEINPENYISGNDDFESYYNQAIESDARKWGDIVMKDVLDDMKDDPWINSGGGGGW